MVGTFDLSRYEPRFSRTETGCWEWQGPFYWDGYGVAYDPRKQKTRRAHRVLYECVIGPIPDGLQIDHLCHNIKCVNPAHLEPVDDRTNKARYGPATKPTCVHGHPFDDMNTRIDKRGHRHCRACGRIEQERVRARRRVTDTAEDRERRREQSRRSHRLYRLNHLDAVRAYEREWDRKRRTHRNLPSL